MTGMARLLLVTGSTRSASTNTATLRTARQVVPAGVIGELYEGLAELPAFRPDPDDRAPPAAVSALRRELAAADAVLFCTPEYAGTLPGSFKNLIDWTVGGGDLYRKPVGWVNVAGPGRGSGASADLARVLRYVDATVIKTGGFRLPVPRDAVGPDGTISDEERRTAVAAIVRTMTEAIGRSADDTSSQRAPATPATARPEGGRQVRIARRTGRLDRIAGFYRDGLGLPEIDRFSGHEGYDGVMIALPGTGAHLEFTASGEGEPPAPDAESLLVLYLGDRPTVDELVARSGVRPVPSANPYWDRVGVTLVDPDGFRVVLVADRWPAGPRTGSLSG